MSRFFVWYTSEYSKELENGGVFKHMDEHTLTDVEEAKAYITSHSYSFSDELEDAAGIGDRAAAVRYLQEHRDRYQYVGYDTGRLDRVLCVEISTVNGRDRATAALYEHPEHGLLWLEMY